MIKKSLYVKYLGQKALKPTILSPTNDSHWSSVFNPSLSWRYNGSDQQFEYRIQIFNIPYNIEFTDPNDRDTVLIKSSWSSSTTGHAAFYKETSENNVNDVLDEANADANGYGYVELTDQTTVESVTPSSSEIEQFVDDTGSLLSLSGYSAGVGFVEDGIYLWRIQVKGLVSREWSNWDYSGFIRVDRSTPEILNVVSETQYLNHPTLSVISDLNTPTMYVERSTGEKDYGVTDKQGLQITYDYRDESLILRLHGDPSESNNRSYGILTFHTKESIDNLESYSGYTGPDSDFLYPYEIIDSLYVYEIDRNDDEDSAYRGPNEQVVFEERLADSTYHPTRTDLFLPRIDLILSRQTSEDKTFYEPILKGIPLFPAVGGVSSIYNLITDSSAFPWLTDPTKTYYSIFPFNTYLVSSSKQYQFKKDPRFPNSDINNSETWPDAVNFEQFGHNGQLLEMRYPPPFQDCFVLFGLNTDGKPTRILCYGQYSNWDDVVSVGRNPSTENGPFVMLRGYNVEGNRAERPNISEDLASYYSLFENNSYDVENFPYTDMANVQNRLRATGYADGEQNKTGGYLQQPLQSPYLFFNLFPKTNKDTAIKIKLRPEAIRIVERSLNFTRGAYSSNSSFDQAGKNKLGFVEFHMHPGTDCSLATNEDYYKHKIRVDEVMIGGGRISPRDLNAFHYSYSSSDTGKRFMRDLLVETSQYTLSDGTTREIESTKVFPINESDFDDGDVVFVNESTFSKDDKEDILEWTDSADESPTYVFSKGSNTALSVITEYFEADFYGDVDLSNNTIYYLILNDATDITNFESALEDIWGSGNVPFSGSTSVPGVDVVVPTYWYPYPLYDTWVEVYDASGNQIDLGKELRFSHFRRQDDGSGGYFYTLAFSPWGFVWAEDNTLTSLDDQVYSIKIRTETTPFSTLNLDNNDGSYTPIHYLTLEDEVSPIASGFPSSATENSFLELTKSNSDGDYRILDIEDVSLNNRSFKRINFYPLSWGADYNQYLSLNPTTQLSEITGNTIDLLLYNSDVVDSRKYNGSFQILVPPKYDFIPYYHPNAVSVLDADSFATEETVPHILEASALEDDWNSITVEDDDTETSVGKLNRKFFYANDYIKFYGNSRRLGQFYPYYNNAEKWEGLDDTYQPVGTFLMNTHKLYNRIAAMRDAFELGWFGYSMFYNGVSVDGSLYNRRDFGLYGIQEIENLTGKTRFGMKNFSNHLFRESTYFSFDGNDDSELRDSVTLESDDIFTYGISSAAGTTFGGIENSVLDLENYNRWIYTEENSFLIQALTGLDPSHQGMYGENDISSRSWMEFSGKENPFGTHFLSWDNSSVDHFEPVMRVIAEDSDEESDAIFLRGLTDLIDLPDDTTGIITGDYFSIGNIFGKVYTANQNTIRIYFDIAESLSGIKDFRYFVQDVTTTSVGDVNFDSPDSSIYLGDEDHNDALNNPVKLQVLNNTGTGFVERETDYSLFSDLTGGVISWSNEENALVKSNSFAEYTKTTSPESNLTFIGYPLSFFKPGSRIISATSRISLGYINYAGDDSLNATLTFVIKYKDGSFSSSSQTVALTSSSQTTYSTTHTVWAGGVDPIEVNDIQDLRVQVRSSEPATEDALRIYWVEAKWTYEEPQTPASFATLYRSDYSVVEDYLSDNIVNWTNFSNSKDITTLSEDEIENEYGVTRVYADIPISGTGYKMIHFQVRNKSGTSSNIRSMAVNISNEEASEVKSINYAEMLIDNSENLKYLDFSRTDNSLSENNVFKFYKNLVSNDQDRYRSLVVKNIWNSTDSSLYDDCESLLSGFSDNYGLSYSVFAPFTSYVPWDITLPVAIPQKPFSVYGRSLEPDWFFDPNHVRHYTVDSQNEIDANIASDLNPGNIGITPITIVGLMEEGNEDDARQGLGKSNPIAKKIYENREEFIGKKLVLGADLSQKFTILHIFKSEKIDPVKRIPDATDTSTTTEIDGDGFTPSGEVKAAPKIWVVIQDANAIGAMILSRRFQHFQSESDTATIADYANYKIYTGWREFVSDIGTSNQEIDYTTSVYSSGAVDNHGNKTVNFGYLSVDEIDEDNLETVNLALKTDSTGTIPQYVNSSSDIDESDLLRETFYMAPTILTEKSSGIQTQEGWITKIYKIFSSETFNWESLSHSNIVGIEVLDRMVFGNEYQIRCEVRRREQFTLNEVDKRAIYINPGDFVRVVTSETSGVTTTTYEDQGSARLDVTMSSGNATDGFEYEIVKVSGSTTTTLETGRLQNVSSDGLCALLDDDADIETGDFWSTGWGSIEDVADDTYYIYLTIPPLQTTNPITNEYLDYGWWPSVDGFYLGTGDTAIGTVTNYDEDEAKALTFAIESSGAFYVDQEGEYTFKILTETNKTRSDVEFCIDYLRHESVTSPVTGYVRIEDPSDSTKSIMSLKNVGGLVDGNLQRTFYLKEGWHIGRLRYKSSTNGKRYLSVLYRKPEWNTYYDGTSLTNDEWIPLVGSRNSNKKFMQRGFRSIHGRLINKDGEIYPSANYYNKTALKDSEMNTLRAIAGFGSLDAGESVTYKNAAIWATKKTDFESYGKVNMSKSSADRVYSAQVFEEATGVYISNIFDGGKDLRFWKNISWNPTTQSNPDAMDVEFYVRTASTQEELENNLRKWNNIGTNSSDGEIILPAFTDPSASANSLVKFSQQFNSVTSRTEEPVINRFIQFKMVLKSRIYNQVPKVNDVTISYSKESTVNFFTTTFDLNSNILRAILTYNGENDIDTSGVAVSDIQFGICTTEASDGEVSTNFDDYTLIPTNEVFSLSSIGVDKNDKFRVGIRFISTTENVPTVDEFALMWETEKIDNDPEGHWSRTKDL